MKPFIFVLIQGGSSTHLVCKVKIYARFENGISQNIKLLICSIAFKTNFLVEIIGCLLNRIRIVMLVMPNSSFICGRINNFQIKFVFYYLVVTVFLQEGCMPQSTDKFHHLVKAYDFLRYWLVPLKNLF